MEPLSRAVREQSTWGLKLRTCRRLLRLLSTSINRTARKHISQTRPRRASQQKASPIERDSTVTFGDSCWTPPVRFLVNFSLWILPLAVSIIQTDTTDHTNWLHSQMPVRQTLSV
ncbi:hypothetical protein T11_9596 [Trichinella zimbabwensis]|uniref:Uncharacterized protein n=1 Tax=Trichinella zimbabwensis TaxID=268475 RepID=A0A0V1H3V5_9BILA|nr:hypothetical protein T11_9596 [Trichinella zimbabwensis]